MRLIAGNSARNFRLNTNYFIAGTTLFLDRAASAQYTSIINEFLTFTQICDTVGISGVPYSGYMRLAGLDTTGMKSICTVSLLTEHGSGAVGPWTAAETCHFGLSIFETDADNNYILMISPPASAVSERSLQLVKQVAGIETILDTDVILGLDFDTQYIMELDRLGSGGTLVMGVLKDIDGNVLGTVSATDTSLSTGNTGAHGFNATYTVTDIKVV